MDWTIVADDGTSCKIPNDKREEFLDWMASTEAGQREFGGCIVTKLPRRYMLLDPRGIPRHFIFPVFPAETKDFICPQCKERVRVFKGAQVYVHESCPRESVVKTAYQVDWDNQQLLFEES